MHVGSAAQTRIYWLTCASKSKRACSGVYVRTCTRPCKSASISQRTNAHQFRQSADPLRQNGLFLAVFTQWVCSLATTPPRTAISAPPNGGNGVIRDPTRRRHAEARLLMLQNPHRYQHGGHRKTGEPGRATRFGARLRCPRTAAGHGRTTSRRTKPTSTTPSPTGEEGAGGSRGRGRASRRGAAGQHRSGSRTIGPGPGSPAGHQATSTSARPQRTRMNITRAR